MFNNYFSLFYFFLSFVIAAYLFLLTRIARKVVVVVNRQNKLHSSEKDRSHKRPAIAMWGKLWTKKTLSISTGICHNVLRNTFCVSKRFVFVTDAPMSETTCVSVVPSLSVINSVIITAATVILVASDNEKRLRTPQVSVYIFSSLSEYSRRASPFLFFASIPTISVSKTRWIVSSSLDINLNLLKYRICFFLALSFFIAHNRFDFSSSLSNLSCLSHLYPIKIIIKLEKCSGRLR